MEDRGVEQDLIPYVGKLKLSNAHDKEWIIDPDLHGLLYGPCHFVYLLTYHEDVFHTDIMTRDVGTSQRGKGALRVP